MPSTEPNPPRPRGLAYGSQGPVTISLGALPKAEPIRRRAPTPPPAVAPRSSVLSGSLIPGATRRFGALPPAPAKAPATAAAPEPVPNPGPIAEPAGEPARPAAASPIETTVSPPIETISAVAPIATRARRSGPKPALLAAGVVGAVALGGAFLVLNRAQPAENTAADRSTAELAAAAPAIGSSLPSERADPLPPEELRTVTQVAAVAPVASRPPTAAPRTPARASSSSPVAYVGLDEAADARTPAPIVAAAPAVTAAAAPPPVVQTVAPPLVVQTAVAQPIPAEAARARPPSDPDAPFATAPAGLRLNEPRQ